MRTAALALALLLSALTGCQSTGSGEAAGFGGTGRAETPFAATGSAVEVNVAVSLRTGTATFTIQDPSGDVRFEAQVDPTTSLARLMHFDGKPGTWLAVLTYDGADGQRQIEWRSR